MRWRMSVLVILLALNVMLLGAISEKPLPGDTKGASGIGDPYFPMLGNGGYDVSHYTIDLDVEMDVRLIGGSATLTMQATQDLTQFNLDFGGYTIETVEVDGQVNKDAAWYYPTPKDAAKNITGYIAFWKGVKVEA